MKTFCENKDAQRQKYKCKEPCDYCLNQMQSLSICAECGDKLMSWTELGDEICSECTALENFIEIKDIYY